MKKTPVIIKGNKSGIRILLDSELSFEDLLEEVKKKFSDSAEFLGDAKVAVSLEGRELSEEEESVLLQCISEHSRLDVVCLIDNDKKQEEYFTQSLNDRLMQMNSNTGQFFKGNLRSGHVILGDVNAGAQVISTGNVIILGTLNGTVYAGASGRANSFVVALKMNPVQIRIGDVIARSADEKRDPPKEPQIAYLEDNTIYVDTISRQTLSDIKC